MDIILRASVLLMLLSGTAAADPELQLVNYAGSIIDYLASLQAEPLVCVLLDFQKNYRHGNIMEKLVQLPQFENMTKVSVSSSFPVEGSTLPKEPSLLVLNIGSGLEKPTRAELRMLSHFKSNINVVTFVNFEFQRSLQYTIAMFDHYNYNRVVLLEVSRQEVATKNIARMAGISGFPHPRELLGESIRNMRGKPLTYTSVGGSLNRIQHIFNPIRQWLVECARRLNTTARYANHNCNRANVKTFDECYVAHFLSNEIIMGLEPVQITSRTDPKALPLFYLFSVPGSTVIMVPRGNVMNTAQLFIMPFSWSTWIVLTGVLLTVELAHLGRPGLFSNDPVLLAVCGIEQVSLHKTGRLEKSILLSLIMFIFFMSNAYETKFISLLISKPSTQSIRTVEDLIASGILIRSDGTLRQSNEARLQLGKLTIHLENWAHNIAMNGIDAYYMEKSSAEASLVVDVDLENQRRSRYVLLEDSFGIALLGARQLFRNPLASSFRWTEIALLESGIMDQWNKQRMIDLRKYFIRPFEYDPQLGQMLIFGDFGPAWVALGIGIAISVLVFACELVVGVCKNWVGLRNRCCKKRKQCWESSSRSS